jgi:prevent-host-death family protein
MEPVNIHDAKTHLSRLIERVRKGEEIVIAKGGKPVARLVGVAQTGKPRAPGLLKGRIRVGKEFDAPLPDEILRLFEG